jgi:hypothetical protein
MLESALPIARKLRREAGASARTISFYAHPVAAAATMMDRCWSVPTRILRHYSRPATPRGSLKSIPARRAFIAINVGFHGRIGWKMHLDP